MLGLAWVGEYPACELLAWAGALLYLSGCPLIQQRRIGSAQGVLLSGIAYMHDGFEVRSLAFDFAELAGLEGVNKEAP